MFNDLGHPTRTALGWAAGDESADVLVGLHARRSAASIEAWRAKWPGRPIVVVLTGTDLYRDIRTDASAQASMALADRLVVLQEAGLDELSASLRSKTHVIYQSTPRMASLTRVPKAHGSEGVFQALMVGHLRDEKDPATFMRAARHLSSRSDIALSHVGGGLDASLHQQALETQICWPNYRFVGPLNHQDTLERIASADVLVHASRMEGGAHVILEAVQCATPVLASRISGNVGMLGEGYAGYFELGDELALAALVARCRDDATFLALLARQCEARSHLFEPIAEQAALQALIAGI